MFLSNDQTEEATPPCTVGLHTRFQCRISTLCNACGVMGWDFVERSLNFMEASTHSLELSEAAQQTWPAVPASNQYNNHSKDRYRRCLHNNIGLLFGVIEKPFYGHG